MRIIITGALGHIGSYFLREIPKSSKFKDITLIDSLVTQRYTSFFNLPKNANYKFLNKDILKDDISEWVEAGDIIINLSAMTDAEGSFEHAKLLEENNFQCTMRLAKICIKNKAKLITLSSTSVYGDQSELVDEDLAYSLLNPQSPYAETKLKEEKLISSLVKEEGLEAIILRFGTIFGISKGMRFHTAVNKFCWQASLGEPLTIWESAYNLKRPYLDLIDAASALLFLIDFNKFDGNIYNIVTGNYTVKEVVDEIKKFSEVEIKFVNSKIINQLSYEVSTEKIKKIGFSFNGNLTRGIEDTLTLLNN
jgi:nucleoside-diphosphate-sugar epimerase